MQKNGGRKMKTLKDKMIPRWIKEKRKRRKQTDYAMRIFLVVALIIIILSSTRNCSDWINI